MLAEQQRAKSEIEAALTIAAARPRDQKAALDRIVTTCQRMGVASNSQYQFARGGTSISGPNIRLLEVIAQNWGNIEWGFRELSRFPGTNGQPGESVVEAMAWDLETNSRIRKQFTVSHSERTKRGLKTFTDPRDIYEWIANQAQRRVRTCLENIIPRDIQDAACEECDRTMKANLKIGPATISQLLERFAKVGVTKEMLEARIQRRIDTITPAQIIGLGKIFASLQDGMSRVEDWFSVTEPETPKTAVEKAKEALAPKAKPAAAPPTAPPPADPDDDAVAFTECTEALANAKTEADVVQVETYLANATTLSEGVVARIRGLIAETRQALTAKTPSEKPKRGRGQLFDQQQQPRDPRQEG